MYGAKFESVEEYQHQEALKPYYESSYYQEDTFTFKQKLELASLLNTANKINTISFVLLGFVIFAFLINILFPLIQLAGSLLLVLSIVVLVVSFTISNKAVQVISGWYIKSKIADFRLINLEKTSKENLKVASQLSS